MKSAIVFAGDWAANCVLLAFLRHTAGHAMLALCAYLWRDFLCQMHVEGCQVASRPQLELCVQTHANTPEGGCWDGNTRGLLQMHRTCISSKAVYSNIQGYRRERIGIQFHLILHLLEQSWEISF